MEERAVSPTYQGYDKILESIQNRVKSSLEEAQRASKQNSPTKKKMTNKASPNRVSKQQSRRSRLPLDDEDSGSSESDELDWEYSVTLFNFFLLLGLAS
jgi:hypothetical protein